MLKNWLGTYLGINLCAILIHFNALDEDEDDIKLHTKTKNPILFSV